MFLNRLIFLQAFSEPGPDWVRIINNGYIQLIIKPFDFNTAFSVLVVKHYRVLGLFKKIQDLESEPKLDKKQRLNVSRFVSLGLWSFAANIL